MTPLDHANAGQLVASDPAVSAFVDASAGSGKTKLLTDRLLRLMLAGAAPARIQCLTFTRAAAAEMAIRLQRTLGAWVTLDDAALDVALAALALAPDEALRGRARALFAEVLDLPGGMRIGTIHAFCQSLLRRFPLEAALSPHFRLVEDQDAALRLTEAREAALAGAETPDAVAALREVAGLASADGFAGLVRALLGARGERALAGGVDALVARQARALGVSQMHPDGVVAEAIHWPEEGTVRRAALRAQAEGAPTIIDGAGRMLGWLGLDDADRIEHWAQWRGLFLRDDGVARGPGALANKKLAERHPDLVAAFADEQARLELVEDMLRAIRLAAVSAALVRLAAPVLAGFAADKADGALLDYDDLITRTSRLLVDPGAAWVLYKLDGGLDHLLLDEVQDIAPAQWAIAGAMTAEFFAGSGAREARRTVFAVGDPKQSIYSFQGADPAAFDHWRGLLHQRVTASGESWREAALGVSFRSTTPVLALVDAVFAGPASAGVTPPGMLRHIAARAGHAGSVELWPLAPAPPAEERAPWTVPDRNLGLVSARQTLADALAAWIAAQTGGAVPLESRGRMLAPGDVLVLVRKRDAFARSLLRALKQRGVPVAGLDRLVLTEQPSVQDLLALADALLLPDDDLTLACVLTGPFGGLDDDSLMDLAVGRRGTLWQALRARAEEHPQWGAAARFLAALLARVDFAPPHALLAEALGPLGGRARLFARLGPEAAEPVDELLNAALTFAATHPPSLQGFVHWVRQTATEVKREPEGAGGAVRIMTVHGAKGLQAPLVVLPDTTALPPDRDTLIWTDDEVPLWVANKSLRCAPAQQLKAAARTAALEEYNRLLYVALTRAEDRLLVCGWQPARDPPEDSWYPRVAAGFAALGAGASAFAPWQGERLVLASPQRDPPRAAAAAAHAAPLAPPAWAGAAPGWTPAPPPAEPARPAPLAPSRPEGAALGPVPVAASPLVRVAGGADRFRRGRVVHALLQHLPGIAAADRAHAARSWLARPGQRLDPPEVERILAETLAILDHPELRALFAPGSRAEVPLTGVVGDSVVGGLVDRLAVLDDRVLLADYKTNRDPPARPDDVPVLYLRQMAAYRAVLRGAFPGRAVACALVWTRAGRVMTLPDAALDPHAPAA